MAFNTARVDEHGNYRHLAAGQEDQPHISVVPLGFNEVAALASSDVALEFEAYLADKDGRVRPVIAAVSTFRGTRPHVNMTYAVDSTTGRIDRSRPVGARIKVSFTDGFGRSSEGHLFTTPDAEEHARLGSSSNTSRTREALFLPYGHIDEERGNRPVTKPLAKIHGSEMIVSCVIASIGPSDLEVRVRDLLNREFGDDLGNVVSIETRQAAADRVDVFDVETGAPVAVNILAAEATYMGNSDNLEIRPANAAVIVGR